MSGVSLIFFLNVRCEFFFLNGLSWYAASQAALDTSTVYTYMYRKIILRWFCCAIFVWSLKAGCNTCQRFSRVRTSFATRTFLRFSSEIFKLFYGSVSLGSIRFDSVRLYVWSFRNLTDLFDSGLWIKHPTIHFDSVRFDSVLRFPLFVQPVRFGNVASAFGSDRFQILWDCGSSTVSSSRAVE